MTQIYEKIKEATAAIQNRTSIQPQIGIILGSGFKDLLISESMKNCIEIPYTDIPHFHGVTLEGHAGSMKFGYFEGIPTVMLNGRFHLYEGYPIDEAVFPTRVLCSLGIHTLVMTNTVGAINTRYRLGDLMLIEDHLNLMGDNPLRDPRLKGLGPQYPDMTEAYSRVCRSLMDQGATAAKIPVHQGVYAGMLGPTFETPAEVRMLRVLGADVVGMSTVHETIAAHHLGVRVTAICAVTGFASGLSKKQSTKTEVSERAQKNLKEVEMILKTALPLMANPIQSSIKEVTSEVSVS